MQVTIKFQANVPTFADDAFDKMVVRRVIFKTGEGPCHRFVGQLDHEVKDGMLVITQVSFDTPEQASEWADEVEHLKAVGRGTVRFLQLAKVAVKDTFTYLLKDIVGRIHVTEQ